MKITPIFEELINEVELIGYHGTTDKGYGRYQYTYYTSDIEYAKKYAENKGRIIKAIISINHPFVIKATYMGYGEIVLHNKIIGFYRDLKKETVDELINADYDGIIVDYEDKKGFEIIPFNSTQVKIIN